MKSKILACLSVLLLLPTVASSQMNTKSHVDDGSALSLTEKQASHFAALALKCVAREFPNKPEHVINNATEVKSPKALHPAFYGCYDWHSSVHGHWIPPASRSRSSAFFTLPAVPSGSTSVA